MNTVTSPSLGSNAPYIYKILPCGGSLVSISSDNSLRLADSHTLQYTHTINSIHDGVSCLATSGHCVLTAGRDGVKCTDLRKRSLSWTTETKVPVLSLAAQGNLVAVGTEMTNSQASIIIWDLRARRQPLLEYVESHSDDVTDLSFQPANPSILLSGSTDGLVNLYDTKITEEDDALIQVFNHGSSIAHAGFLSDQELYALSSDEIFSIYDTGDFQPDGDHEVTRAFGDLRPQLQCEYLVDLVTSASTGPILAAGSHSTQSLNLVPLQKEPRWSLDTLHAQSLPGAHGDEVVRSICFNDDHSTIFTAGEDGLIRAWLAPAEADRSTSTEETAITTKKQKKHRSLERAERARFKPY